MSTQHVSSQLTLANRKDGGRGRTISYKMPQSLNHFWSQRERWLVFVVSHRVYMKQVITNRCAASPEASERGQHQLGNDGTFPISVR